MHVCGRWKREPELSDYATVHQEWEPSELGFLSLFKALCKLVKEFSFRVREMEMTRGVLFLIFIIF